MKISALLLLLALSACQSAPPPAPMAAASLDMQRVLDTYRASGARPVDTLTVEQARAQPSIQDAAELVAASLGRPAGAPIARTTDMQVPGAQGSLIPARLYNPLARSGPAPAILYFHGGGWVTGTLDTYDATARALARGTGAIVIAVQVRQGPEFRFPTAHDDAIATYRWLLGAAGGLGANPKRIALAGESAGGNLALDTAIWARDRQQPAPVHLLLVYPVAGTDLRTPSYNETAGAIPLIRRAIEWYVNNYTTTAKDLQDPRLDIVGHADLRGLPPTTIVSAEIDPLRSEGETLAAKLQAAGTPVTQRTYPGTTHEFFGMPRAVAAAQQAQSFAIDRLNTAFGPRTPFPAVTRRARTRR